MAEGEKDENDGATTRWDDKRRKQLGYVNNLILTFAVGAIAFVCDRVGDEHVELTLYAKVACVCSTIILLVSALAGILLAYNRLVDLRETAEIVKYKRKENSPCADPPFDKAVLKGKRENNRCTGAKTWILLRWQMGAFFVGLVGVAISFALIYWQKLF